MITSTTKILYLHGLDSTLQDDRRAVLAPYGEIVAPVLDYRNTPDLFSTLVRDCNGYYRVECWWISGLLSGTSVAKTVFALQSSFHL